MDNFKDGFSCILQILKSKEENYLLSLVKEKYNKNPKGNSLSTKIKPMKEGKRYALERLICHRSISIVFFTIYLHMFFVQFYPSSTTSAHVIDFDLLPFSWNFPNLMRFWLSVFLKSFILKQDVLPCCYYQYCNGKSVEFGKYYIGIK